MNKLFVALAATSFAVMLAMPVQAEARTKPTGVNAGAGVAQSTEFSSRRRWRNRHVGYRRVYAGPRRAYWGPRRAYWGPRRAYWGPRRAYWGPRRAYWGPRRLLGAPGLLGPAPRLLGPAPRLLGAAPCLLGPALCVARPPAGQYRIRVRSACGIRVRLRPRLGVVTQPVLSTTRKARSRGPFV